MGVSINTLTFNGRYVGWTALANDQPQVYDVQRRQIVLLPVKYRINPVETTNVIANEFEWNEDPNTSDTSPDPNRQLPGVWSFMAIPGT